MQNATDFLQEDPSSWDNNEYYRISCLRVQLKVVNDAAERGVSLIQNFNSIITNQEKQKQYLLQVVERHRQQFPVSKKSIIVEELSKEWIKQYLNCASYIVPFLNTLNTLILNTIQGAPKRGGAEKLLKFRNALRFLSKIFKISRKEDSSQKCQILLKLLKGFGS